MQKSKVLLISLIAAIFIATAGLYVFFTKDAVAPSDIQKHAQNTKSKTDKKTFSDQTAVKDACFQTLKDNLREAGTFDHVIGEIDKMTYQELSTKFSRNYKGLSSFGLDIDRDDLEMRIYSFGAQTGYIHPPITPFPTSTKSEMWDAPAKEYIVAEEYIKDDDGNIRFLDCAFMHISAEDLAKVTRENYLYDGGMVSLNKTAEDQSYKAWYSENISFDHAGNPFVNWRRLFVYPQASQNDYFDKYTVADAYPANKVASFDVLTFFMQPMIQLQDYDESNRPTIKIITLDENGNEKELTMPKELEPMTYEGINRMFPMHGYYQAIENQFPVFATLLSFRGTLKYTTFKELISSKQDPEVEKILVALADYRQLVSYERNKKANENSGGVMTDPDFDKLSVAVRDADKAVGEINGADENESIQKETSNDRDIVLYALAVLFVLLIGAVIYLRIMSKRG